MFTIGSSIAFAEMIYFDLITFALVFASIGLYMVTTQFVGRFIIMGHATIRKPEVKEKTKKIDAQEELNSMMRSYNGQPTENNTEDNN